MPRGEQVFDTAARLVGVATTDNSGGNRVVMISEIRTRTGAPDPAPAPEEFVVVKRRASVPPRFGAALHLRAVVKIRSQPAAMSDGSRGSLTPGEIEQLFVVVESSLRSVTRLGAEPPISGG